MILRNKWTGLVIASLLMCLVFSLGALAQTKDDPPLDEEEVSTLVDELKEGLPEFIEDEAKATAIADKWDAHEDLAGKTKEQILKLLFEDVKSVVNDNEIVGNIWKHWTEEEESEDEESPTPPDKTPEKPITPPVNGSTARNEMQQTGTVKSVNVEKPTVEEVLEKHNEAMGGLDAFNQIRTAKMIGTIIQQGIEMPITIQIINNKAYRTDLEVMAGTSVITVYHNGTGWIQNLGLKTPTEISGVELLKAKADASLASNLMDYQNRGHQVKLVGKENVEGVECYKINLINKDDGREYSYYIGVSNHLVIKSVSPRELSGQRVDLEYFYSDFVKINGLMFAKTKVQKIAGEEVQSLRLDKIELNIPIDEKIFQK